MTALSISELNTTINHEPRILDLTLAERLGMSDRHKIRPLIDANRQELEAHGEVSAQRAETSQRGDRPSVAYYLNEAQALLVCMFSRTPRAAEVRKAVIEVFMEYRQQKPKPANAVRRRWERWLTPNDREELRKLWATGAWTLGQLAVRYHMSISGVRGHLKDIDRGSSRIDTTNPDALCRAMLKSIGEPVEATATYFILPAADRGDYLFIRN